MKRTAVFMMMLVLAAACSKTETPAAPPKAAAKPVPATRAIAPAPTSSAEPPATTTASAANVGDVMPAYSAKMLDGAPYELAADKGSVVLLNVWATWCGPCRFEMPELQKLHDQYAKRGFKVVGISVDEGDVAEVKTFVADQKMSYPVAHDPEGHIANILQTMVLPTTVLLDRGGKVTWRQVGAITPNDPTLIKAIDAALGKS